MLTFTFVFVLDFLYNIRICLQFREVFEIKKNFTHLLKEGKRIKLMFIWLIERSALLFQVFFFFLSFEIHRKIFCVIFFLRLSFVALFLLLSHQPNFNADIWFEMLYVRAYVYCSRLIASKNGKNGFSYLCYCIQYNTVHCLLYSGLSIHCSYIMWFVALPFLWLCYSLLVFTNFLLFFFFLYVYI